VEVATLTVLLAADESASGTRTDLKIDGGLLAGPAATRSRD